MKKEKISLTLLIISVLAIILAGCNSNEQEYIPTTTVNEAGTTTTTYSGITATCTAQGQELPDLAREGDHITGELENYAVTVVVYNDFNCEECKVMAQALDKALELYPGDIRLIFRNFPEVADERSIVLAKAAEAAGMQGKFWEMHDLLYSNQEAWMGLEDWEFQDWLWQQATNLELDLDQFEVDANSEAVSEMIAASYEQGLALKSTPPAVVVNGTFTPQYISTIGDFYIWLQTLMIPYGRHINELQFTECPPITIDPNAKYTATLHTEKGDVVLALWPDVAPFAVNSFVFLAENDYYDNIPFYAVVEGFIAQSGDPSGTGWGTPGYLFSMETSPGVGFDKPGMLAMANAGPDANNSQFFITFSPLTHLNGQYTIFGEVLSGMDVLKSLTLRDPERNPLADPGDLILDITITKK